MPPPGTATAASPPIGISGTWRLSISNVLSSCGAEEAYTNDIGIDQDSTDVRVEGLGDPREEWLGTIEGDTLRFDGDRLEGVGVTTAYFELLIDRTTEPWTLMGTERWEHTNCRVGSSSVSGTKIR